MATQDPEPGLHRPAVKAMSTLAREMSILLGIGYGLSVVLALGALVAAFSSHGFDPSVACERSGGLIKGARIRSPGFRLRCSSSD